MHFLADVQHEDLAALTSCGLDLAMGSNGAGSSSDWVDLDEDLYLELRWG